MTSDFGAGVVRRRYGKTVINLPRHKTPRPPRLCKVEPEPWGDQQSQPRHRTSSSYHAFDCDTKRQDSLFSGMPDGLSPLVLFSRWPPVGKREAAVKRVQIRTERFFV